MVRITTSINEYWYKNHCLKQQKFPFEITIYMGAWVAHSVKHLTLDSQSQEFKSHVGLHARHGTYLQNKYICKSHHFMRLPI